MTHFLSTIPVSFANKARKLARAPYPAITPAMKHMVANAIWSIPLLARQTLAALAGCGHSFLVAPQCTATWAPKATTLWDHPQARDLKALCAGKHQRQADRQAPKRSSRHTSTGRTTRQRSVPCDQNTNNLRSVQLKTQTEICSHA